MAQIDHVIDARAEEIVGGGAGKLHKNSQKSRTRGCEIWGYLSREDAKTRAKSNSYE
jgi:hypothetical protein